MNIFFKRFILLIMIIFWQPISPGWSDLKTYEIKKYGDMNILCDSYTVQPGDDLFNLLKNRGEIAEKNFTEFLRIFKYFNPHITNPNNASPGHCILIPLKKTEPDMLYDQDSDMISLPLIPIINIPDFFYNYSKDYTIRPGDSISHIIAKDFGKYGTTAYNKGIRLLKLINPQLHDINKLYAGDTILLPHPGILEELERNPNNIKPTSKLALDIFFPDSLKSKNNKLDYLFSTFAFDIDSEIHGKKESISFLDKLISNFKEYDPASEIILEDHGLKIILRAQRLVVKNTKKGINYLGINVISSKQQALSDCVFQYLNKKNIIIKEWLKSEKSFIEHSECSLEPNFLTKISGSGTKNFVSRFAKAMGYNYDKYIAFSFPYAKFHVETLAYLLKTKTGKELIVDFGELYGSDMKNKYFKIVKIKEHEKKVIAIKKILDVLSISYKENPIFFATDRPANETVSFTIPGLLIYTQKGRNVLMTNASLNSELIAFFDEKNLKIIQIRNEESSQNKSGIRLLLDKLIEW
ncbi:putative LysM domain-containing protein [Candidatus Magnetomoraceae bacterium gMMP-15]